MGAYQSVTGSRQTKFSVRVEAIHHRLPAGYGVFYGLYDGALVIGARTEIGNSVVTICARGEEVSWTENQWGCLLSLELL